MDHDNSKATDWALSVRCVRSESSNSVDAPPYSYYITTTSFNNLQDIDIITSVTITESASSSDYLQDCVNDGIGTTCLDGTIYTGMNGSRYVFVYPADMVNGLTSWGAHGTDITGANSSTDGWQNTADIVNSGLVGASEAGMLCANSAHFGYDDWYLPARDELTLMYNNSGTGNFNYSDIDGQDYWSSTEYSSTRVRERSLSGGSESYDTDKNSPTSHVRCIRSTDNLSSVSGTSQIRWLVSFDGKPYSDVSKQWKKWNNSSQEWENATTDLSAYDIQAEGNTTSEIETGLSNYVMGEGETSLDFAADLYSSNGLTVPRVESIVINYYPGIE